jgi:hypothetical protein
MSLSAFIRRDLWERARRNPDYLSLCERFSFDPEGYLDLEAARLGGRQTLRLFRCLRRFGLTMLIRPTKDFDGINPSCFIGAVGVPERLPPENEAHVTEETLLARMDCYGVWDQRAGRKSLREIADSKRETRQEKLGPLISKVKEDFYQAFHLIMGYPLESEALRSLQARLDQTRMPCGDCPDEECRLAMKEKASCFPCADYMRAIYDADFL